MRVLHVITGLGRGGAEGALYRLAVAQDSDDVTVVSLTSEGIYGPRLREADIEVHSLGLASPLSLFGAVCRLRYLMKEKQPEVVQTWMYHADLVGGLVAWTLSLPVCWGIRNSGDALLAGKLSTRLMGKLCAVFSRFVPSRIVSCSRRAVAKHQFLGYSAPFEVVPNGFDMERWTMPHRTSVARAELGLPLDSFVFAHAARADPQKGHATLAIAFSLAYESNPLLRLLLCGDGLNQGSAHFDSLPFSPRARSAVLALGPRDDLPNLWQSADAFVLSSFAEGFPNVVAEAMACGLPCVVTDVGDASEIVADTGCVVPPSDSVALAKGMLELSRISCEDRAHLSAGARKRILDNFTLRRMVEGFRQVWREVVAERRQACRG